MKILVLNGPNLNLLGIREPEIYGHKTYGDLTELISDYAQMKGVEVRCRQTNHEGVLVDWIQEALGAYDGIIINPAAYTHTSIAIADAIMGVGIPAVEVHLSDVDSREAFRQISYVAPVCLGTVKGKGFQGYLEAMDLLIEALKK